MNLLQALSHLIYGQPRNEAEVRGELDEIERIEALAGRTTLRGDMLRFEIARRGLVSALFARKAT